MLQHTHKLDRTRSSALPPVGCNCGTRPYEQKLNFPLFLSLFISFIRSLSSLMVTCFLSCRTCACEYSSSNIWMQVCLIHTFIHSFSHHRCSRGRYYLKLTIPPSYKHDALLLWSSSSLFNAYTNASYLHISRRRRPILIEVVYARTHSPPKIQTHTHKHCLCQISKHPHLHSIGSEHSISNQHVPFTSFIRLFAPD